jgi:hypothetical protein
MFVQKITIEFDNAIVEEEFYDGSIIRKSEIDVKDTDEMRQDADKIRMNLPANNKLTFYRSYRDSGHHLLQITVYGCYNDTMYNVNLKDYAKYYVPELNIVIK